MIQKATSSDNSGWFNYIVILVSLIVVGIIVIFLARFQRGIIGVVLSIVSAVLLIYWVRELKKNVTTTFGQQVSSAPKDPLVDIIKRADGLTIVLEVPGPEDKVKTRLKNDVLEIKGGQNFKKTIDLDLQASIESTTYVNGILTVKLSKLS